MTNPDQSNEALNRCMDGLQRAIHANDKMKDLTDSMFVTSTRKMQEMDNALTVMGGKHFISLVLVTVAVVVAVTLLIWKVRKFKKYHDELLAFRNIGARKIVELQGLVKELEDELAQTESAYESGYKPIPVDNVEVKSLWPWRAPWSFVIFIIVAYFIFMKITF